MMLPRSAALFTAALCAAVFGAPTETYAQTALKKLVFEDCNAAREEAKKLTGEELTDFISYLGRVLEMQAGAEILLDTPAPQPQPGSPLNMPLDSLWRTFEPSREMDAKRCAVDLMVVTVPYSFTLIGQVFELLENPTLAADVRAEIEQNLWNLVLRVAGDEQFSVQEPQFAALLKRLGGDESFLAEHFLVELHQHTVPRMIERLRAPDAALRDQLVRILLRIDDAGHYIGPRLLPLLNSADDDLRIRTIHLLEKLEGFYPKALPALVRRLADPSAEVEAALYAALPRVFSKLSQLPLWPDNELIQRLIRHFQTATAEQRLVLADGISLFLNEPITVERLVELLAAEDETLRAAAIELLSRKEEIPDDLLQTITERLYDGAIAVRLSAIRALARVAGRDAVRTRALVRLLKSVSEERDPFTRELLIKEIARTSLSLKQGPDLRPMIPYFTEALGYREERKSDSTAYRLAEGRSSSSPASEALVHIGSAAVSAVTKALRHDDPLVRKRAVWVLGRLSPVPARNRRLVVHMLKDWNKEVRRETETTLAAFGSMSISDLLPVLEWPEENARKSAARVLMRLGKSDAVKPELAKEAFTGLPCSEKGLLLRELEAEAAQPALAPLLGEFESTFVGCLAKEGVDTRKLQDALIAVSPLSPGALAALNEMLASERLAADFRLQLIEHGAAMGLEEPQLVTLLLQLLHEGDNSVKQRVLTILPKYRTHAAAALPELQAIYQSQEQENVLRTKAVAAAASIDPNSVDATKFFLEELESDRFSWALAAIRRMDPTIAVPLLTAALKEFKESKRNQIVQALGDLGQPAGAAVPELLPLLSDSDPLLRYHAVAALMKIDPMLPPLVTAIRREFRGRYAGSFQNENFSLRQAPLLEKVLESPQSFVEYRAAARLLRQIAQ